MRPKNYLNDNAVSGFKIREGDKLNGMFIRYVQFKGNGLAVNLYVLLGNGS
jgi:hypothetical protein